MLFTQVEDVKFKGHVSESELHNTISELIIALEVAKNGLPRMIGT